MSYEIREALFQLGELYYDKRQQESLATSLIEAAKSEAAARYEELVGVVKAVISEYGLDRPDEPNGGSLDRLFELIDLQQQEERRG